jgi:hypothetical protein
MRSALTIIRTENRFSEANSRPSEGGVAEAGARSAAKQSRIRLSAQVLAALRRKVVTPEHLPIRGKYLYRAFLERNDEVSKAWRDAGGIVPWVYSVLHL